MVKKGLLSDSIPACNANIVTSSCSLNKDMFCEGVKPSALWLCFPLVKCPGFSQFQINKYIHSLVPLLQSQPDPELLIATHSCIYSCSCFMGGKPFSALSPGSCSMCLSCFPLLLYHHLWIMLLTLILATGYIAFPSPFSALHPKVGEDGQPGLLSIPGLNLIYYTPWLFPYSTPKVNDIQEIRVFPFVKEARENIFYGSVWVCLLCFTPLVALSVINRFHPGLAVDSCKDSKDS